MYNHIIGTSSIKLGDYHFTYSLNIAKPYLSKLHFQSEIKVVYRDHATRK